MDPQMLNMSLISSLRTGNIIVDLIIAAMVPALFVGLWQEAQSRWVRLTGWLWRMREERGTVYRRHIAHTKSTPFDDEVDECANHVLQNAIRTYIGSQLPAVYLRGSVRLSEIKSVGSGGRPRHRYDDSDDDNNEAAAGADSGKSIFEGGRLKVLSLPKTDSGPVEIEPGLMFQERMNVEENNEDEDRGRGGRQNNATRQSELIYTLISGGHGGKSGKAIVDAFLDKVMKWYIAEVAKQEDDSRWMYQPLVASAGTADRLYKRYKLSSEKTFNSLFFNEKDRVVRVLDAFTNKTGKYQIKGFPHRLSILLHGPPGTGKTSLVKAIAMHTGRHVVSVPLSRMKTNQEFIDVMMDCVFKYCVPTGGGGGGDNDNDDGEAGNDGGTKRAQLSYDEVVFLLEDVDAASTVVHRKPAAPSAEPEGRSGARSQQQSQQQQSSQQPISEATSRVVSPTSKSAAAGDFAAIVETVDGEAGAMFRAGTAAYNDEATGAGEAAAADAAAPSSPSASSRATPPPEGSAATAAVAVANAAVPSSSGGGKGKSDSESDSDDDGADRKRRGRRGNNGKNGNGNSGADTTEQLAKMCQMLIQQQGAANKKGGGGMLADLLAEGESDALSLESILTVLDGVIDTPGRILVMTTNHPERLDPSLIRNGRINMKLYMGHLNAAQVKHMAAHYYPEATPAGITSVVDAFTRLSSPASSDAAAAPSSPSNELGSGALVDVTTTRISPAEFEQLCAECVEISDLAARINEMALAAPLAAPSAPPTPPCSPIQI